MTQVQNSPQVLDKPPSSGRSTLSKVATIALLGNALTYFDFLLQSFLTGHGIVIPLVLFGGVALLGTALSCLRFRWAPALGGGLSLGLLAVQTLIPLYYYVFSHPSEAVRFVPALALVAFGLVGGIMGIAATVQNYRHPGAPAPGYLGLLLTSLTTFVLGMMVVSLIGAANPPSSTASTTTTGQPTVHLSLSTFAQNVVLVPKGSALRLVGNAVNKHVLRNGFWTAAGSPQSRVEPGAPVVSDVSIRSGSLDLGPYATAGIYHLYCTIHPNMNLTVVVQ